MLSYFDSISIPPKKYFKEASKQYGNAIVDNASAQPVVELIHTAD